MCQRHIGIAQAINQTLPWEFKNMSNLDYIHIQVNIEAFPFSKAHTKAQLWSILGNIVASDPFIIGLFSGNQTLSSSSIHECLDDIIAECSILSSLDSTLIRRTLAFVCNVTF